MYGAKCHNCRFFEIKLADAERELTVEKKRRTHAEARLLELTDRYFRLTDALISDLSK